MTLDELTKPLIRASFVCAALGVLVGVLANTPLTYMRFPYRAYRNFVGVGVMGGLLQAWLAGRAAGVETWLLMVPVAIGFLATVTTYLTLGWDRDSALHDPNYPLKIALFVLGYFTAAAGRIAYLRLWASAR